MTNVTIIGAGLMGSATAWPLADNGHRVRLVGTHLDVETIQSCQQRHYHPRLKRELPPGVKAYYFEEVADALADTEVIVCGVNSLGIHWMGQVLAEYAQPGQTVIGITKGLEVSPDGQVMILPDVLSQALPPPIRSQIHFGAVGGPCIAGELAGRRQTGVVFGSRDQATVEKLACTFRTPYYHVWTTTDLVGLEYSAALKNAYTLGVGLAYGLLTKAGGPDAAQANMHNLAAAIFAQGCTEMELLLRQAGASTFFAYGLPGAGDLYVTSAGGRTVRLGTLLGQGHTYCEARQIMAGETLESAEIIQAMAQILPRWIEQKTIRVGDLPLLQTLIDVISQGQAVTLPLERFFGNLRDD